MNHAIGKIVFSVSPVSVMKCWVGIGWSFRGTKAELVDYRTFSDRFFSFLFSQSNEMGIHEFCAACAQEAENITSDLGDAARRFGSRLRGRLLLPKNQNQVQQEADEYASRVAAWLDSSEGRCGTLAVERMCNWGLVPPCDGLGAVDSFGNAVFGKYVPTLMAVCVQLDVVANSISPTLQFLETLLHEEIHAYIHQGMGNDPNRGELTWLNELCAVCTANYALKVAVEKQLTGTAQSEALHVLAKIVEGLKYGELANAVRARTDDPLFTLRVWQELFTLPADQKLAYAHDRVITPLLKNKGWNVEFPFKYGNGKYVTVFA